jgi:hypothetical protein
MPLTATIKASIAALLTGANDMANPSLQFTEAFSLPIADGNAADQANNVFCDERTLGASATENLDLAGGLTNALGATLTFTAIKAILVIASASNTNNVVLGGAGANTFVGPFGDASDKIVIGPGDSFLITRRSAAGMAVTAGTGDILLVANSGAGTAVTYRIVIIGEA